MSITLIVIVGIAAAILVAGQAGAFRGKPRGSLGVSDARLQKPSKTENSVSSQSALWPDHPMAKAAYVEPFVFSGEPQAAMLKLDAIVKAHPRTSIVTANASYLYAQCTTALLGFTDDVEFLVDPAARVIHVRSASRLGRKDFNANRQRVEALRAAFNAS